jgi:hypothetical protein
LLNLLNSLLKSLDSLEKLDSLVESRDVAKLSGLLETTEIAFDRRSKFGA